VNPCAPTAYDDRPPQEIEAHIEQAMTQTFEAADTLGAETIVIHAGRYLPGEHTAARDGFHRFLDRYFDPRLTLENLPAVYRATPCLAMTPGNSRTLPAERSPNSASTSPTSPAPQTTGASRSRRNWKGSSPST